MQAPTMLVILQMPGSSITATAIIFNSKVFLSYNLPSFPFSFYLTPSMPIHGHHGLQSLHLSLFLQSISQHWPFFGCDYKVVAIKLAN